MKNLLLYRAALATVFCSAPMIITDASAQTQAPQNLAAPILTPTAGPQPRINGPRVFGVRPRHPILFTIAATGTRPMNFSADNLPPGATLDAQTGRIAGAVTQPGTYQITLHARNAHGDAARDFKLVVGETLALTPPMGWNHYNIYGTHITQEQVLAQAQAMATSGLINHGWSYLNIDDGWQGQRGGERNAIMSDPKLFPDMKLLCDQIHALGLKVGTYSTPWIQSYGRRIGGSAMNAAGDFQATKDDAAKRNKKLVPYTIGTYKFYENDAAQFADWGFDYLKYDWNPIEVPETRAMYEALRASGRDVVFSLSNSTPFETVPDLMPYSNAWRTGGDIKDSWGQLKSRLFTQDKWAPYAGPGHWNDPDMLIVGVVGWNVAEKHPTKLTPDEQYAHISAWCLMSVPLLLGCDLTKLDGFTLGLLTNDEVLAVNQDPLGRQATTISRQGENGVMAKKMEDGSHAVGLFNLGDNGAQKVTVKWANLGIEGPRIVRDLWRQQDLGTFDGEFSAQVNQHGVAMVSVR